MAGAISRRDNKLAQSLLAFALSAALIAEPAMAQAQDNPAAPTAPATDAGANAAEPAAGESFSRDELEKLLAPIALYPDPLLAQMLPASAYPVQIVQAQRWLDKNKALVAKNDYSGIDNQNWDPAVKALARFPDVIKTMSADLDWTTDLGDAEVNQPQDVAEVIQDLRAKAEAAGTLKTTDQQTVERVEASAPPGAGAPQGSTAPQAEPSYISIQPTDPSTVYVPTYDPAAVYQPYSGLAPLLGFGAGIAVGALWNNNYWNWGTGAIYPPTWAGYSGWSGNINNGNVNIGNNVRPWRPNGDYRPGMGSKPGIGANRPGGVGRRPGRPGGVGGAGPSRWDWRAGWHRGARRYRWRRPAWRARWRSAGQAVPAASAAQEGLAVQADPAGRGELVVQAGPAAGKPLIVRRGVLAVALARRRGPPTVLLGGRTSAGPEVRRWAVCRMGGANAAFANRGAMSRGGMAGGFGGAGVGAASVAAGAAASAAVGVAAASVAAGVEAVSAAAGVAAADVAAAGVGPTCGSSTISCCSGGSTTASATIASSTTAATPPMSG